MEARPSPDLKPGLQPSRRGKSRAGFDQNSPQEDTKEEERISRERGEKKVVAQISTGT